MKRLVVIILFGGLTVGGFFLFQSFSPDVEAQETIVEVQAEPEIIETIDRYTIEDGDTFTDVMEQLNVAYSDALEIVEAADGIFDFTTIKVGKEIRIVSLDGVQDRIEYEPNSEMIVTVDLINGTYLTVEEEILYEIEITTAQVTIDESLYLSGLNADLPELLILKFAEIFAWEIDFATQVQKNDTMEVVYEKRYRNGEEAGVGNVLAGRFTNSGELASAYLFIDSGGNASYYDEGGDSLVRPFLKAPLSYSRITSGFSYARFHPVTGTTSPHRAIDYAAPIGTPILAVGDGTVILAQYSGGYGNFIKIRHNGMYQTHYAHLSKYAVSAGEKVKQGDVIGYVGSTGFSTGPHLHYEIQVNGTLVNPLEVEFPKGDPIVEEERESFFNERDRLEGFFD